SNRSRTSRTIDRRSPGRSGPASALPNHRAEMLLEPAIAFARPAGQARSILDADDAATGRDQPVTLERLNDGVDRRTLGTQQAGERLLRELDAVAGPVLRVEQPARGALGDRMVGVARDRLHDLRQQVIGKAAEQVP